MIVTLILIAVATAAISWLASFGSKRLAEKTGTINEPTGGKKIHAQPTPQLGGIGIGATIILAIIVGLYAGWFPTERIHPVQMYGFIGALTLFMIVGFLDDKYDVPPGARLFCYFLGSLLVILTGTTIAHVTNLSGHGAFSLLWNQVGPFSFPADLLTLVWLLSVTIATKYLDGLDGLVTGLTVIGSGLITSLALSAAYFEPPVAVMAAMTGGAYLGFLPRNVHPAKQFLGESGSVIAGFSLGFLAIVSGAKVAVALMALGLPLVDAVYVTIGRLCRGVSPLKGDRTHIHHRLMDAGLSQRQTVLALWSVAFLFGVAALGAQTRVKIFLFIALAVLTVFLSTIARFFVGRKQAPHD